VPSWPNQIRETSESSGAVSVCLLPRVFREICGKLFFVSSRLGGYISLCSLWPLWLIFNQKRGYSPTKIEKSKKFLSPFLTSTYGNHKSRIDHFFRLKRAGSPYYRGTFFPSLSLPSMLAHLLFCRGASRPQHKS